MNYECNILVNGSRCRQYNHNGKIFVEAKKGSEYSIEIKNNQWGRILAVCSVDGLDILSGKPALENEEVPGYVINGYGSAKFDGFRVSNETVAKFVFDYKDRSYAASKKDDSERNVGVIGVRLFSEKVKPVPPPQDIHIHHHHNHYPNNPYWHYPSIWCDSTLSGTFKDSNAAAESLDWMGAEYERDSGPVYGACGPAGDTKGGPEKYDCSNIPTKGASNDTIKFRRMLGNSSNNTKGITRSANNTLGIVACNMAEPLGFDMGTKFGAAKEGRVIEVDFERGLQAFSTNIYYASRQSLIEMGIPLGNEKQVNFPEPFSDNKYAKPPKGWRG